MRGQLKVKLVVWGIHLHPLQGPCWALRPRFVDYNLAKTMDHLKSLDVLEQAARRGPAAAASCSLQLLTNSVAFGAVVPAVAISPNAVGRVVTKYAQFAAQGLDLAPSQREALRHVASHQLTLLWGPPGTGKTHCLALCVLQLLEAAALSGCERFHIVMTAFTNSAMDTFVAKLRTLVERRDTALGKQDLAILDLRDNPSRTPLPVRGFRQKPFAIAVGSVWSIAKRVYQREPTYDGGTVYLFDLLVVDEASQLQVADAAIALDCVKPGGRIVIAGDHLQLRPLLKALIRCHPSTSPTLPQASCRRCCGLRKTTAASTCCAPRVACTQRTFAACQNSVACVGRSRSSRSPSTGSGSRQRRSTN